MAEDDEDVNLTPQEQFYIAASKGDVAAITALLDGRPDNGLDINGKDDASGLTALNLAISEGYLAVMYPLLEAKAHIGDAMLRAVDADFHEAVRVLLQFADERDEQERMAIINCRSESDDFHPDITPIIRAAQLNSFAIVKILLEADLLIPELNADDFQDMDADDLQRSVGTLEVYAGLASEAYVCLASTDPIDRAFTLCGTMKRIGALEVEFKVRYLELADKMERLAAELVSYARDSEEITTVLTFQETGNPSGNTPSGNNQRHIGTLPKVTQAIQYEQRQFVAHPNTQQAVSSQFYRHLAHLRDKPPIFNFLAFLGLVFAYPFLAILYKLGVSEKARQLVRTPYVKFVMQAGADFSMLIILPNIDTHAQMTITQYILHFILLLFVIGIGWREMYLVYLWGAKKIMHSFTHIRDMLITAFLLAYFVLISVSVNKSENWCTATEPLSRSLRQSVNDTVEPNITVFLDDFNSNLKDITRLRLEEMAINLNDQSRNLLEDIINAIIVNLGCGTSGAAISQGGLMTEQVTTPATTCTRESVILDLGWSDPSLISNTIFGLVTVLAFTKVMSFLIANDFVGPLVISVGDMVKRTSGFFLFLIAVVISFSSAMTFNYSFYSHADTERCEEEPMGDECDTTHYYNSLWRSMLSLYWSLFGLIGQDSMHIPNTPWVIQGAGELLYAAFYIFAVLVLLNALIAVMSNVFNKVEENADVEWKFARTKLWMSFLDDTITVPPPFNLIPNFSHFKRRLQVWRQNCCRRPSKKTELNNVTMNEIPKRHRTYKRVDLGNYQRIMRRLVERFIAERTAQEANAQGEITVADIRNLRNDVVSLRYDTFKQLCQMNEELDDSKQKSTSISGQSVKADVVFTRTDKIKEEIDAYSSRLADVQSELEQKLEILPAIEELMRQLAEMNKVSGMPETLGKRVLDMVGYYEEVKDIVAASKQGRKPAQSSALTRRPGLTLTLENEEQNDTWL